jgi:hypothetical protein
VAPAPLPLPATNLACRLRLEIVTDAPPPHPSYEVSNAETRAPVAEDRSMSPRRISPEHLASADVVGCPNGRLKMRPWRDASRFAVARSFFLSEPNLLTLRNQGSY